jgi:hypothetical protein
MHLRAPAVGRETSGLLWGAGLGLYVFLFMLAIGIGMGVSAITSALSAFVVFLLVVLFGDDPRRARL